MTINQLNSKLENKAKQLWPKCYRWSVVSQIEAWSDNRKSKYRSHLMGFYNDKHSEAESFVVETDSIQKIFDEVNKKLDELPKRIRIELD